MSDFADMAWLFSSTPASRGVVRLNIAEAAMLWRYAGKARTGMVEIGRRHGGSTCLMACANESTPLVSIDIAPEHDARCEESLKRDNVTLVVGDSGEHRHTMAYDLAFIDGDHTNEGVRRDFESVRGSLVPGATILFHDAARGGYGACDGVVRYVEELVSSGAVEILETADSMVACRLKSGSSRKLTVGMLTHDDYDGVYFTIQSLRAHHPEAIANVEFLILDNNPKGRHGQAVKKFCGWVKDVPTRYIPVEDIKSTSLRNRVFEFASTPHVLCLDCHVLLVPGALQRLIAYLDTDDGNLLHGPLLYDNLEIGATHMEPTWRSGMWGIWAIDKRGLDLNAEPFEIPAHGLGVFACRRDAWLGFNPAFRGFGGEECYIHEKFRKAGRKALCLPFLRWIHRFDRPTPPTYPNRWEDRVANYLIGHRELGLDVTPVVEHFSTILTRSKVEAILASLP